MRLYDRRFIIVILVLAAIGILYRLVTHPSGMLIPVLVLGTVFLLYKFPPGRWRRRGGYRRDAAPRPPASASGNRRQNRNKAKFRVIPGNKKDDPSRK
jgi:hypothetical protein